MGNRANFVVVKGGQWRLFYAHWAGCRMLDALIAGPALALRYIEAQRHCGNDEWLDDVWSDGGAVVDFDEQRLLFFGDELMPGIPERRAMLAVLPELWPGYRVSWAYRGMAEIAAYVGHELGQSCRDFARTPKLARGRQSLCHLVSAKGPDGEVRLWPLWWGRSSAWCGQGLLAQLPGPGQKRLRLGVIPESGVHIDSAEKRIGMWCTGEAADIHAVLPSLWPGWRIEWWEERYEEQLVLCDGAVRVPELDLGSATENARNWLKERIFQRFEDSPAGQVLQLATILDEMRPGLEVCSDAIADTTTRPTSAEWARFDDACTRRIQVCTATD